MLVYKEFKKTPKKYKQQREAKVARCTIVSQSHLGSRGKYIFYDIFVSDLKLM